MKVTQEDIIEFNKLYLELRTYAAVARKTGFSASTVKKYIIPGYQPAEVKEIRRFSGELPNVEFEIFRKDDWASFIQLSEKEVEEIKEFWEELEL